MKKVVMAIVATMAIVVGVSSAEDKPTPDPEMAARVAAAEARLKARTAAATQAVVSDDPAVLKAIILDQKQQIDSLRAQVARLTQEIATAKNNGQPGAGAPEIAQKQPTKKPPRIPKAGMGFTDLTMDAVGYLTADKVVSVIDDSSAIIEIALYDAKTTQPVGGFNQPITRTLLLKGISTEGLADGSVLGDLPTFATIRSLGKPLPPFIITSTQKIGGTTYFVAEPIAQPGKTRKPLK